MNERLLHIQEEVAAVFSRDVMYYKWLSVYRWLVANFIVFAFMFSGLQINAFSSITAPMWFASGAATAFMFMRGETILAGIGAGSAVAYFYAGANGLVAIEAALIWCLQSFLLFRLSLRWISPSLIFVSKRKYLYFIALSSLITGVCTLLLMIVSLNHVTINMMLWSKWWCANLNGVLVFAAALCTWDYYFPEMPTMQKNVIIKLIGKLGLLMAIVIFMISAQDAYLMLLLSGMCMATITLYKYQYGWCGGMASLFVFALTLVFAHLMNLNVSYLPNILTLSVFTTAFISTAIKS